MRSSAAATSAADCSARIAADGPALMRRLAPVLDLVMMRRQLLNLKSLAEPLPAYRRALRRRRRGSRRGLAGARGGDVLRAGTFPRASSDGSWGPRAASRRLPASPASTRRGSSSSTVSIASPATASVRARGPARRARTRRHARSPTRPLPGADRSRLPRSSDRHRAATCSRVRRTARCAWSARRRERQPEQPAAVREEAVQLQAGRGAARARPRRA